MSVTSLGLNLPTSEVLSVQNGTMQKCHLDSKSANCRDAETNDCTEL